MEDDLIDDLILAFLLQENDHIETRQDLETSKQSVAWFTNGLSEIQREANKPIGDIRWTRMLVRSMGETADNTIKRDADSTAPIIIRKEK